jgi:hypothetical protein
VLCTIIRRLWIPFGPSGFHFFRFRDFFFTEQGRRPCVQLPTLRTRALYLCPPVTGSPIYAASIGFPFHRLWRHGELRWRCSNPPPHETQTYIVHNIRYRVLRKELYYFESLRNTRHTVTFGTSLWSSFWNTLHYQWKPHWTVTILDKTRCILLHFDSLKHCACPLNKSI